MLKIEGRAWRMRNEKNRTEPNRTESRELNNKRKMKKNIIYSSVLFHTYCIKWSSKRQTFYVTDVLLNI